MSKVYLVGINNPYSEDPAHALYPHPPGCTGYRLWQIIRDAVDEGFTRSQYIEYFRRMNLPITRPFPAGARVVLLGNEVRRAVGLKKNLFEPVRLCGVTYYQVPHPSGRNTFYNDPDRRLAVGRLIAGLL